MKAKIITQTWEALCEMAGEYITKKRYAMAIGLVVGFANGWYWF